MQMVKQLLQTKGNQVWTISPDARVFDALKLMADKEVGALVVIEDGEIVGILSERDYARKVILKDKSSKQTAVSEIMSRTVFGVHLDTTVQECMALMTQKRIRHLPVLDNRRLMGVISIGDVVKSIMADQEQLIEHLENYIIGR